MDGPSSADPGPGPSTQAFRQQTAQLNPSTDPISAYFKLEFDGFSYYIQTLKVVIGRRVQVRASFLLCSYSHLLDGETDDGRSGVYLPPSPSSLPSSLTCRFIPL